MPMDNAESILKSFGENMGADVYNSSNISYIVEGPIISSIQETQFLILLPSFVYTAILMLIGMPGNFIVIIVYLLKMTKTTSRHFIISLAACDFVNCAFGMPVELSLLWNFYNFDYPILCKVSRFSTFFMNNTSACVLIAIAVDRFRRVCRPLRPNMTVKHSKIICIAVTIVSMISAFPALFIYGTKTILRPGPLNHTRLVLKTCYVDDSTGPLLPLVFNLYMLIIVILMFIPLAVMYALVGRVVCGKRKFSGPSIKKVKFQSTVSADSKSVLERTRFSTRILKSFSESSPNLFRSNRKSTNRGNSEAPEINEMISHRDGRDGSRDTSVRRHGGQEIRAGRTSLILFIVSLIFVLSFLPYLSIVTIRYVKTDLVKHMTGTGLTLYNLTLRSYLLNSAVNPVIYCFLNRHFRMKVSQFFRSTFCCCIKDN